MRQRKGRNITVIGAGSVGMALSKQLEARGHRIVGVVNRRLSSTEKSAAALKSTACSSGFRDLPRSTDLLIIAAPDGAVPAVATLIASRSPLRFDKLIAFHTSGVLTSAALHPLRSMGSTVFSLHPIQSFPQGSPLARRVRSLSGIYYGFEGDAAASRVARKVVSELGGRYIEISAEHKVLYHVACVLASNCLVVLMSSLQHASEGAGIKGTQFSKVFRPLIFTALEHVRSTSPMEALTGPIERGDVSTIESHLEELRTSRPELLPVYSSLGRELVQLALKKKSLTEHQAQEMLKLFKG